MFGIEIVFNAIIDESEKLLHNINNIAGDLIDESTAEMNKINDAVESIKNKVEEGAQILKNEAEKIADEAMEDLKDIHSDIDKILIDTQKAIEQLEKEAEDLANKAGEEVKKELLKLLYVTVAKINAQVLKMIPKFEQDKDKVRSDWMKLVSDETHLSAMSIPGSHDSISHKIASGVLMAQTHLFNIENQFKSGIRYFDIRGTYTNATNDDFELCHGVIPQGEKFRKLLDQLFDLLEKHPKETILIQLKCEDNDSSYCDKLDILTAKIISDFGTDRFVLDSEYTTLGKARGKIVILQRFGENAATRGMYLNFSNNKITKETSHAIQDCYDVSVKQKIKDVELFFENYCSNETFISSNRLMINFLSLAPHILDDNYMIDKSRLTPLTISLNINSKFLKFLRSQKNGHAGVTILDGIGLDTTTDKIIELLIYNNYESHLAAFKIEGGNIINAYLNVKVTDSIKLPDDSPFSNLGSDQNIKAKKWKNYYPQLVNFHLKGKSYIAGQSTSGSKFFIQEILHDGSLGKETLWEDEWGNRSQTLTVIEIEDRVFLLGSSSSYDDFFTKEVLEGGKLAEKESYLGNRIGYFNKLISFSTEGKTYIGGQNTVGFYFFIQEITLEKDSISSIDLKEWKGDLNYISWEYGGWYFNASSLTVVNVDNKSYLLGQSNLGVRKAQIWEVTSKGDLSKELLYESEWNHYYPNLFSFNKNGNTYVAGQSENKKIVFIDRVYMGNDGKLHFTNVVNYRNWIFSVQNLLPVQVGDEIFISGQIKNFIDS